MSTPFLAEIRVFGFNFAPQGWALCNGQILPISQNTALFSLIGTMYGGDGTSTFGLPNMQSRAPMNFGQGPGLSLRDLGEQAGAENVTLLSTEMPTHTHTLAATAARGTTASPSGAALSVGPPTVPLYAPASAANGTMNASDVSLAGGNQPHNNMQPYLALNFCIALQGMFPARN